MPTIPDERAVMLGVLVGIGNMLIYQHYLPTTMDVRQADQFDVGAEAAEREALFMSIAFTAIVAGYVKSWHTFVIAGAAIVAIDFAHKHANAIHPLTQSMKSPGGTTAANSYPLPDYATTG